MKRTLLVSPILVALALTTGCGSQSPDDKKPADSTAITVNEAQKAEIAKPGNLMDCQTLHSDSAICSFKPGLSLVAEPAKGPTLVTLQYTLKCAAEKGNELSHIALRTPDQVRRLQYNVENRSISILNSEGTGVELAKILQNDQVQALSGPSRCWYFKIEVKDVEALTSDSVSPEEANAGQTAQQRG